MKFTRYIVLTLLPFFCVPAFSAIQIGNGGALMLGGGHIDLAGGDLRIDGQLDVGNGALEGIGTVLINGAVNGSSGLMQVWGDWINHGDFAGGTGEVHLVDESGLASQIRGATIFSNLSMTTASSGRFVLEAGLEQRVIDTLTILSLGGISIQIESDSPPQPAFLWLDPEGTQIISNVGVSNVHATGQHLAPDQTNQGGSGNDLGWFGRGLEAIPVPTLSLTGLVLLVLALLALGHVGQARRYG